MATEEQGGAEELSPDAPRTMVQRLATSLKSAVATAVAKVARPLHTFPSILQLNSNQNPHEAFLRMLTKIIPTIAPTNDSSNVKFNGKPSSFTG